MEKYYDKMGKEIFPNMILEHDDGEQQKVYATIDNDLGFNASNEEYEGFNELNRELYPLYQFNLKEWKIIKK
jgi:hypothetical protein